MRKLPESTGAAASKTAAPDTAASAWAGPGGDLDLEYHLQDSIAYQLRNTYKCFVQNLMPYLDQYDISIGMWYYLRVLWEEDGLTQRQISERVGLVAPTTVEQLKNMEKRGLLERWRSNEDRRKIHVFLTAEGRALRDKLLPSAPLVNAVALKGLTPGEIGFLRLVLTRMQHNLIAHAAVSGARLDEAI
jgi:DNA-binding MarR family transcriptional regulator